MSTHSVKLETLPWSRNFPVLTPPRSVTLYSTSLLVHSAWESLDAEAFVVWNDLSAKQRNTQCYNIHLIIFSHTSIISRSLLLLPNRKLCYSLTSCNAWFFRLSCMNLSDKPYYFLSEVQVRFPFSVLRVKNVFHFDGLPRVKWGYNWITELSYSRHVFFPDRQLKRVLGGLWLGDWGELM